MVKRYQANISKKLTRNIGYQSVLQINCSLTENKFHTLRLSDTLSLRAAIKCESRIHLISCMAERRARILPLISQELLVTDNDNTGGVQWAWVMSWYTGTNTQSRQYLSR